MPKVALIQMNSTANVTVNLAAAKEFIATAARFHPQLIILPENFTFMGFHDQARIDVAEKFGNGPIQNFLHEMAIKHHVWIIAGTLPLKTSNPNKVRSASLVYDAAGHCRYRYDKIHMFDVSVADAKENYQESKSTEPGKDIVVADTPVGKVGLSVCYDLRFPELYRAQVQQGAECFVIPAAFTKVTGIAHWETLCRARAIENLAYVFACGQEGTHENGRETFGHSMIIDPWGEILARIPTGTGVITAEIDLSKQKVIRQQFPSLAHRIFV